MRIRAESGGVILTWDPELRSIKSTFAPGTFVRGKTAKRLAPVLDVWVGFEYEPYCWLFDGSQAAGYSLHYRSVGYRQMVRKFFDNHPLAKVALWNVRAEAKLMPEALGLPDNSLKFFTGELDARNWLRTEGFRV